MKKVLLFLLIIASGLSGQTLTQTFHEPDAGDLEFVYRIDTSAYKLGLPVGEGDAADWDLQKLKTQGPGKVYRYLDTSLVTQSSEFPGCSFVLERPEFNSYFRSNSSPQRTELLGISSSTLLLTFTNSAVVIQYPASFGSLSSDLVSGSFDVSITSGSCFGNIQTIVDGRGKLRLPGRTYENVLRVKSVLKVTLSAGIIPVGSLEQVVIMFYHNSQKFPLLSLNFTTIAFLTGPSTTTTDHTLNFEGVAGLDETSAGIQRAIVYPNPANDRIKIHLPEGAGELKDVAVYDMHGRLVISGQSPEIDTNGLLPAAYFMKIHTHSGAVFHARFARF